MKQFLTILFMILPITALLIACGDTFAPAPDLPPTATAQPDQIAANLSSPDLARGQQIFLDKQCVACHDSVAGGGIGPQLAGTTLPFDNFLHVIRTAQPPKPAFNETELTTQDVYNIYGWLQSIDQVEVVPAAAPVLQPGEVLGMTLWTEGGCDTCHGAFAQGSPNGPTLAGISYPYEMERANMRQTADAIPEHAAEHMRDVILQRLYIWLQAGANPNGGC